MGKSFAYLLPPIVMLMTALGKMTVLNILFIFHYCVILMDGVYTYTQRIGVAIAFRRNQFY